MEKIPANCPRCNARQKFTVKEHFSGDKIEKYIQCKKCYWRKVTKSGKSSIIKEREEIKRLEAKVHNVPGLQKVIDKKKEKIARLNKKTN